MVPPACQQPSEGLRGHPWVPQGLYVFNHYVSGLGNDTRIICVLYQSTYYMRITYRETLFTSLHHTHASEHITTRMLSPGEWHLRIHFVGSSSQQRLGCCGVFGRVQTTPFVGLRHSLDPLLCNGSNSAMLSSFPRLPCPQRPRRLERARRGPTRLSKSILR